MNTTTTTPAEPLTLAKLNAETVRLHDETVKLHREAGNLTRGAFWYPLLASSGVVLTVTVVTLICIAKFHGVSA